MVGSKIRTPLSTGHSSFNHYRKKQKLLTATNSKGKIRTSSTCNRFLATLSHLLSVSSKQWEIISENSVKKISREKEPRERTRFLNSEERQRFLIASQESDNPLLHTFIVLLLSTGCHYSEIRQLKWTDIELFKGRITITQSKNGDVRFVPIRGLALDLLRKLASESNSIGYVFAFKNQNKPIDPRRSIRTAIRRAQLVNFRPHEQTLLCKRIIGSRTIFRRNFTFIRPPRHSHDPPLTSRRITVHRCSFQDVRANF